MFFWKPYYNYFIYFDTAQCVNSWQLPKGKYLYYMYLLIGLASAINFFDKIVKEKNVFRAKGKLICCCKDIVLFNVLSFINNASIPWSFESVILVFVFLCIFIQPAGSSWLRKQSNHSQEVKSVRRYKIDRILRWDKNSFFNSPILRTLW